MPVLIAAPFIFNKSVFVSLVVLETTREDGNISGAASDDTTRSVEGKSVNFSVVRLGDGSFSLPS